MKRGTRVIANNGKDANGHDIKHDAVVLGPEDFDGYERNSPGPNWALIGYNGQFTKEGYKGGAMVWAGIKSLEVKQ
jgi:hypothetical protein